MATVKCRGKRTEHSRMDGSTPATRSDAMPKGTTSSSIASRCDRQRGKNISSYEAELNVAEHPGASEVAAIAVPSNLGEGDVTIRVVREATAELSADQLSSSLMERMPHFMLARYIEFIDDLPLTDTGKISDVHFRESGDTARTWDRLAALNDT